MTRVQTGATGSPRIAWGYACQFHLHYWAAEIMTLYSARESILELTQFHGNASMFTLTKYIFFLGTPGFGAELLAGLYC